MLIEADRRAPARSSLNIESGIFGFQASALDYGTSNEPFYFEFFNIFWSLFCAQTIDMSIAEIDTLRTKYFMREEVFIVTGSILVAMFVLIVAVMFVQNRRAPALGVVEGKLKPLSKKPNGVSTQTDDASKRVEPLAVKASTAETMTAIKSAGNAYGGASIQQESENYLYLVFTTAKMKYNDDVEFFIDDSNGLVHFRSSSRAGYSDLGLNKARYKKLAAVYSQQN